MKEIIKKYIYLNIRFLKNLELYRNIYLILMFFSLKFSYLLRLSQYFYVFRIIEFYSLLILNFSRNKLDMIPSYAFLYPWFYLHLDPTHCNINLVLHKKYFLSRKCCLGGGGKLSPLSGFKSIFKYILLFYEYFLFRTF